MTVIVMWRAEGFEDAAVSVLSLPFLRDRQCFEWVASLGCKSNGQGRRADPGFGRLSTS